MERDDPRTGGRKAGRKRQGIGRILARLFALPLAGLFALLCAACSDPVDVFYSTDYPVLRVEAEVTLDGVGSGGSGEETGDDSGEPGMPGDDTGADDPSGGGTGGDTSGSGGTDDGTGSGDPSGDGDGTGTGTGSDTDDPEPSTDTEAIVEAIHAAVLNEAPVAAGGSYRLDFNRADGGNLYVTAAAGAEPVAGTFTKIPASTELTFAYGDRTYSAHLLHYSDDGGPSRVRFAVDLTDLYRERYGIESGLRVVRYEYTDHLTD